MSLKQPVSQVRLTNVAVVRLKRKGKRFELACYKNKVMSWRDGTEKDLDEVLQTDSIFANVSKGILANTKDLQTAFHTADSNKVVLEILRHGELQVSEKERQHQTDNLFHEIAAIVADKCVDPTTKRPFSVGIIERAMRDTIHYAVVPNKTAKVQAQSVIKQLREHMNISRAQMRLQLSLPLHSSKQIKEKLKEHIQSLEHERWDGPYEASVLVDPGSFRVIVDLVSAETRGQGSVEVVSLAVVEEAEETLS